MFPHFGTSLSLAFGIPLVFISGKNLAHAAQVDFGTRPNWLFGSPGTAFLQLSDSIIIALVPPGSGTVNVTVTTANGTSATSSADKFTYVKP